MCNTISLVEENLLNENYILYNLLLNNPPRWWTIVRADPELYIEVRKKNEIIVYYRGGRLAGAVYKARTGVIEVTAHPKYLGHNDTSDSRYYHPNDKHLPIYQPCEDWIENNLARMKALIRENYVGDPDGDDTAEKLIQGELIINKRDKYIDSEFSHRLYNGKRLQVRIDLVKVENNKIIFEELKRIEDPRLVTRNPETDPEIITQMQNYRQFLRANAERLAEYYKALFKIKRLLLLPVPTVENVDSLTVDIEPRLIIKHYEAHDDIVESVNSTLARINVTPIYF